MRRVEIIQPPGRKNDAVKNIERRAVSNREHLNKRVVVAMRKREPFGVRS